MLPVRAIVASFVPLLLEPRKVAELAPGACDGVSREHENAQLRAEDAMQQIWEPRAHEVGWRAVRGHKFLGAPGFPKLSTDA
eukprot:scaffold10067_cov67-Phaeocystis_antarctica.AAC.13